MTDLIRQFQTDGLNIKSDFYFKYQLLLLFILNY